MIITKDHELYETLLRRFNGARISPSAEPPKEIEYQGVNWRRVEDNDELKFVATGNVSDFQAKYSGSSFQASQSAPVTSKPAAKKRQPKGEVESVAATTDETPSEEPPQE